MCNAQVIRVAGHSPPARGEQLRSLLGREICEICSHDVAQSIDQSLIQSPRRTLGVTSIPELILFVIRCPEYVISEKVDREDHGTPYIPQLFWPEGKVTCLKRIHEGYPE